MRNAIPMLTLLCLLFACSKDDQQLRPNKTLAYQNAAGNCDIQSLYSSYFSFANNFGYLKTYFPWGETDSVAINLFGPYNLSGRVKYDSNRVYLIGPAPTDTSFRAELNAQGKVTRAKHGLGDSYTQEWAYFTYNSAGQLTHFIRDSIYSDDYYVNYDSLGNVKQFVVPKNGHTINFEYDYSTPITGSDYDIEYYYSLMNTLKVCEVLNLINLQPHHKLVHAWCSDIYPPFDNYYSNQFFDASGKLIYYQIGTRAYTVNWFCQ